MQRDRYVRPVIALGAAMLAAVGCGEAATGPLPDAHVAYTFVVLPDTQYYSSSWPAIYEAQTRWIRDNREVQRIAFVLHTGDLVDRDVPEQWNVAERAMHLLDGQVPYVVTAGNHDYSNIADRVGMANTYFPSSDYVGRSWFGGLFEPDHIENSFSIFNVPDGRWLVIALEFGPRDEVLGWANDILRTHSEMAAIVITHAYLYRDGTRYDHVGSPDQEYNPHDYIMVGAPGTTINDGPKCGRS